MRSFVLLYGHFFLQVHFDTAELAEYGEVLGLINHVATCATNASLLYRQQSFQVYIEKPPVRTYGMDSW